MISFEPIFQESPIGKAHLHHGFSKASKNIILGIKPLLIL